MLLNQPPGEPRMGKVALATLETMEPTPIEIIMVPSVTMNGGIFSRETRSPLKSAEGEAHDDDQQEGGHHREAVLERRAADDGGAHHDRPDGEVDPAADDDEGDAHRDEPDVVGGVDDVHQGGVGEVVAPEDAEEDVEDDQRGRGKRPLQSRAQRIAAIRLIRDVVSAMRLSSC